MAQWRQVEDGDRSEGWWWFSGAGSDVRRSQFIGLTSWIVCLKHYKVRKLMQTRRVVCILMYNRIVSLKFPQVDFDTQGSYADSSSSKNKSSSSSVIIDVKICYSVHILLSSN